MPKKPKNSKWFSVAYHDISNCWDITRDDSKRKNTVYELLLESVDRKENALTTQRKTHSVRDELLPEQYSVEKQRIEARLLKSKTPTLSMFDTVWVLEQLQQEFTPKQDLWLYEKYFETFLPEERTLIESTYWKSMNQYIIDFARNMIASVQIRQKILTKTQEQFS